MLDAEGWVGEWSSEVKPCFLLARLWRVDALPGRIVRRPWAVADLLEDEAVNGTRSTDVPIGSGEPALRSSRSEEP